MERRAGLELRAAGGKSTPRLAGYAAVFNAPSEDLGGFTEIVRPGAFARSLSAKTPDCMALVHHMPHLVLGRRSAGTLRLSEDSKGLAFEIDLPDTATARDLAVSVERGDITGCSFGFVARKGGDRWETRAGRTIRELLDVELHEITVTPTPAYPDTTVARRALEALQRPLRLSLARRYLETL